MYKLGIAPDRSGYTAKYGDEIIEDDVAGGLPRRRRDFVGAVGRVDVQWTVGAADYEYLAAFFRTASNHGIDSFNIDLILDSPQPQEYEAMFVRDTFKLGSQSGNTYVVNASLYVKPMPDDTDSDLLILGRY